MNANAKMRDMTQGSPAKHIFLFSLPLLLGNVLQQLYNMVDSWTVGNFTGDTALAAVGIAFPVVFLFVSLFIGLGIGSTVVIAQFYGAGETERVRAAIDTAYAAFLIIAIPISLAAFFLTDPILHLLQVEAAAFPEARLYLQIVSLGLVGSIGYNTNAGILQGLGNSKTPLMFLSIAMGINIVLDLLFVAVFRWGVAGVAFATIIAQWFSWIFGIFYINRMYSEFHLHLRGLRIDRNLLRQIVRIGLPAGIQNGLIAAAIMALMARVNLYGTDFTAGFNVGNKVDCFAFLPVQSLSNALTTYTGQNIGAGNQHRVKEGLKASVIMSVVCCLVVGMLLYPTSAFMMRMFSQNPEVIDAGVAYLHGVLPFYFLLALSFMFNSVLRGAGDMLVPMISSFISLWLARLPAAYLLAYLFEKESIYYSYAIGWALGVIISGLYYATGKWKNKSIVARTQKEELA